MNRREQNRALKTLRELESIFADVQEDAPEVIARGTFDSGLRNGTSENDLAKDLQGNAISYADRTGEEAIRQEVADRTGRAIEEFAKHLTLARNIGRWLLQGVPDTTDDAVRRSIPDCEACGQPVFGRVISGYDRECYDRKRALGIADRGEFKRVRLQEIADSVQSP